MHNTSRVDDEPYPQLLQEKGFGGFPSLCFMDAGGNVLVRQSARTVVAFEGTASRLNSLFELRAKVESLRAEIARLRAARWKFRCSERAIAWRWCRISRSMRARYQIDNFDVLDA